MGRVGNRWGVDGPPEEAYGRVTDPSRYAELHTAGREVLDKLERRYAVTREVSTEPDRHGNDPALVVRLVPADPTAAALTIVFDAYPGLIVRMGRDSETSLPGCGCDACDETVEDCTEQLRLLMEALTAGTFGERLVREHGWCHERWYRAEGAGWSGLTPARGRQLRALRAMLPDGELRWTPWHKRGGR